MNNSTMKKILSVKKIVWLSWLVSSLALAGYLGNQLVVEEQKPDFLIGETSHGHYQIELQCDACHTSELGGEEILQNACLTCHEDELKTALDSHPKKKFTDPRNADLVAILDARNCVSCHSEHNEDIMHPMGVTLPEDFCVQCHENIAQERPSHEGMGFETCASAGCHNYHDNRALYEDFLLKHQKPGELAHKTLPATLSNYLQMIGAQWQPESAATVFENEISAAHIESDILLDWQHSAHGNAAVGCNSCHVDAQQNWIEKPGHQECSACHEPQVAGFLNGKHGMRLKAGLSPMTPDLARLPMKPESSHAELGCNSCHAAHTDNTQYAAAEACLTCHADDHSQAFEQSPHGQLWQQVRDGVIASEQGVSCATCHMPVMEQEIFGSEQWLTQHNQNATLRPNEKMIRPTCMQCHSLEFSIDALADPDLINNNFNGLPTHHVPGIEMATQRDH